MKTQQDQSVIRHHCYFRFFNCLVYMLAWLALSLTQVQAYDILGTSTLVEGPAAGIDSVILSVSPATSHWTARANATWVHLSPASQNGTGSANIIFSYDANPGVTRSGTVSTSGGLLTITQAGTNYVAVAPVTTLVSSGLSGPWGLAVNGIGNVYYFEYYHNTIKEWMPANNTVTTVVSPGSQYLAADTAGNVYYAGNKWTAANNTVSTLVPSGFGHVALDSAGNLYFPSGNSIQVMTPVGNVVSNLVSGLSSPGSLAVDIAGNIYFTSSYGIQEWVAASNTVTTLVPPSPYSFIDIAVDSSGNIYIVGEYSYITSRALLKWTAASNMLTTLVSSGEAIYFGVSVDKAGNPYFNDFYGGLVQERPTAFLDKTPKTEGLLAGQDFLPVVLPSTINLSPPFAPSSDSAWLTINGVTGGVVSFSFSTNTGPIRTGNIQLLGQNIPITQVGHTYSLGTTSLVVGSSAGSNSVVLGVLPNNGKWLATSSVAWLHLSAANQSGTGSTNIVFSYDANPGPTRSGNIIISGQTLSITQAGVTYVEAGPLTTLTSSGLNSPSGIAVDSAGNVYLADTGNNAIKEWMAASNAIITLDSTNLANPAGVAVDTAGNVYFCDTGNNAIKEWIAASSTVITLDLTNLSNPAGIAVDGAGNVYLADTGNNAIKEWMAASNAVITLDSTNLANPAGVAVDTTGNVYFADTGNNAIEELPYAFVDPTARWESANAGTDILPMILPPMKNLFYPFVPTSDQSWLSISGYANGLVFFSFAINNGQIRVAHITLLGQVISVTQAGKAVDTPVFSPPSGTGLTNGSLITISCTTPSAVIYFTTNYFPVSTNSAVYGAPIVFTGPGPLGVQAIAIANGYSVSAPAFATYSFPKVIAPVFIPPSGPITNGTSISISTTTPGAMIYYTLDGSIPSTNSTPYSGPLVMNGSFTLSAFAVAAGEIDSAVTSVAYPQAQVGAPQFAPAQGPLTNGTLISTININSNATVYYTVDGSAPTTNSQVYSGPILFTNQFLLKSQAFAAGYLPSSVTSVPYGLLDPVPNVAVTTFAGSPTPGLVDGIGIAAKFSLPQGICMDQSGNVFVADTANNRIRKILPSGQVITFAGNGMVLNSQSASATNAFFDGPSGICFDNAGNLYVAEWGNCNRISRIGADGTFTTYAHVRECGYGGGFGQLIASPTGDLYAGDWAEAYKIFTNGSVQALAGTSCNCPGGWAVSVGLWLDSATNLYAATGGNVWMISPAGSVTLAVGGFSQVSDGPILNSGFTSLTAAAVDASGNVYLGDAVRIRKITKSGWVSTVAGTGEVGYEDGPGTVAQFNGTFPPYLWAVSEMGLCLDASGNLYVSDTANNCIRKISFNTIALPSLQISLSSNLLTLSWPSWATDFILESSDTLSQGGLWSPVTSGAAVLYGGTTYVWTNQIGNGDMYYRLHRQ